MRPEVKKARKQFERTRPKPKAVCDRCGMTAEEHKTLGKSSLQIHHVEAIREVGSRANRADNYVTLDYYCHREWHTFWEPLGLSWEDFMADTPFREQLIRDYK